MLVEEVVVAVRIDVCAAVLLNESEAGDNPHVAGLVAPEGELVTEQLRDTVPVKELAGVTVIVEVMPLTAPGATEILPLFERVKLLVPLGGSQNFEQPTARTTISRAAANNTRPHFPVFIAIPRFTSLIVPGQNGSRPNKVQYHFSRISLVS